MRFGRVLGALGAYVLACSSDPPPPPVATPVKPAWEKVEGPRQPPLPKQTQGITTTFVTSDVCAGCHRAGDGSANVNRDAKGRAVGPADLFRPSVMSIATRDPFYLSAFAGEKAHRPKLGATLDQTCTRCHAPAASIDLGLEQKFPTFDLLTKETGPMAEVAREGVTCSFCHQIAEAGLGTQASFTGGFSVGTERQMFGPYLDPRGQIMELTTNYKPTYGSHIVESKVCGSCHTVFTKTFDAAGRALVEFPEQSTYLEWQNSDYSTEGRPPGTGASCIGCHMPTSDDDGARIVTAIARAPADLAPRPQMGRHGFLGGNSYLLRLIADNAEWSGALASSEAFMEAASQTDKFLTTAVRLSATAARVDAETVELSVTLQNQTGHRFPTGYPSRRAWLHVTAKNAAGVAVFESGKVDSAGRLVSGDAKGGVVARPQAPGAQFHPHYARITSDREVQVYESIPADFTKQIAKRPLDAASYLKDNRLQPTGFQRGHRNYFYMLPKGTEADTDFGSADTTVYVIKAQTGATFDVEVLFQTMRPAELESLNEDPTPVMRSFYDMVRRRPPAPVRIAQVAPVVP